MELVGATKKKSRKGTYRIIENSRIIVDEDVLDVCSLHIDEKGPNSAVRGVRQDIPGENDVDVRREPVAPPPIAAEGHEIQTLQLRGRVSVGIGAYITKSPDFARHFPQYDVHPTRSSSTRQIVQRSHLVLMNHFVGHFTKPLVWFFASNLPASP